MFDYSCTNFFHLRRLKSWEKRKYVVKYAIFLGIVKKDTFKVQKVLCFFYFHIKSIATAKDPKTYCKLLDSHCN